MNRKKVSADAGKETTIATTAEIEAAINALTPPQLLRLKKVAKIKAAKLGRKAQGDSWEDLLADAYTLALSGKRKWDKPQVDFFGFLVGAIWSIASNRRAKFDRTEKSLGLGEAGKLLEVPLYVENDAGEETLLQIASTYPDPESELIIREQERLDQERVQMIERLAEEREFAPFILLELMDGKKGPEIQRSLAITQTQYETEMKWIRRNARKALNA